MSKNRLGKGLGALIGDSSNEQSFEGKISEIYVGNIKPNPFQPRKKFDDESLEELSQSIKENGLIQPITARQTKPDSYQIVSGERRWKAAKMAGYKKIPAILKEYSDRQMMEIALVENLQREDLNPIEKAQAYNKMMTEFKMTQSDVAKKVGKSRSAVANVTRLLKLPPKIQIYVSRGTISMGHARTLLALNDNKLQLKAVEVVKEQGFSVRQTEEYVNELLKKQKNDSEEKNKNKKENNKNEFLDRKWVKAKDTLGNFFEKNIKISSKKNKKIIQIECEDYNDMEDILNKLN